MHLSTYSKETISKKKAITHATMYTFLGNKQPDGKKKK